MTGIGSAYVARRCLWLWLEVGVLTYMLHCLRDQCAPLMTPGVSWWLGFALVSPRAVCAVACTTSVQVNTTSRHLQPDIVQPEQKKRKKKHNMKLSTFVLGAVAPAATLAANESQWIDLFHPPFFSDCPIGIITGLSCASDTACFVSGGQPTSGFHVYESTDQHFREVDTLTVDAPVPIDMLLSIGMQDATTGVVGGIGLLIDGTWYTKDGKEFKASKGEVGLLTTQAVYPLGNDHFAFVGEGTEEGSLGGVGYSKDGGEFFIAHKWPTDLGTDPAATARYGAFPSEDTWFVTGGNWPASTEDKKAAKAAGKRHISQRLVVDMKTGKYERVEPHVSPNNDTSYNAVLTKTTDGGKTWKVLKKDSGNYYYNQIDCFSETKCLAVAEGFEADGSASPGLHIHGTDDGETWNELYIFGADKSGSGMAVKMLSETEAWVAGTYQHSALDNGAVMLHTTDGGKTWDESHVLPDVGDVVAMSFINDTCAYAGAVTIAQDATILALGVSPPPPGPAPVPSDAFEQMQCSDSNCSEGCREGKFQQNSCLQTSSGGSALVNCSADGTVIHTFNYNSSDCTGDSDARSEATQVCEKSTSGDYFENICPTPKAVVGKITEQLTRPQLTYIAN